MCATSDSGFRVDVVNVLPTEAWWWAITRHFGTLRVFAANLGYLYLVSEKIADCIVIGSETQVHEQLKTGNMLKVLASRLESNVPAVLYLLLAIQIYVAAFCLHI